MRPHFDAVYLLYHIHQHQSSTGFLLSHSLPKLETPNRRSKRLSSPLLTTPSLNRSKLIYRQIGHRVSVPVVDELSSSKAKQPSLSISNTSIYGSNALLVLRIRSSPNAANQRHRSMTPCTGSKVYLELASINLKSPLTMTAVVRYRSKLIKDSDPRPPGI